MPPPSDEEICALLVPPASTGPRAVDLYRRIAVIAVNKLMVITANSEETSRSLTGFYNSHRFSSKGHLHHRTEP